MRRAIAALALVAGFLAPSGTAGAETYAACWTATSFDEFWGLERQVTRCRLSGGIVIDYASDTDVPSRLYPNTGTDLTGQCWYYTSASTQYVILVQYANGDADIGFDTDPANPGGIIAIGPTLPRCTSEPSPAIDPSAEVWRYVTQYIHEPPTPDLRPPPGQGVTGLATYAGVIVPDVHTARLSSNGTTLDVYIEVSAVVIEWGDGTTDSYPPNRSLLAGYPGGHAAHVYDTKAPQGVPLAVSYDWTARWRVVGGSWQSLAVPDTTTITGYPLAEVVATLRG